MPRSPFTSKIGAMTLHQFAFVLPVSFVSVIVLSFYISITMAKRVVRPWNSYTTYMFWRSCGLGGVKTRARVIWMERMGYAEIEALIISKHQSRAKLFTALGLFAVMAITSNIVER